MFNQFSISRRNPRRWRADTGCAGNRGPRRGAGFALVLTISLMALLMVVSVGLLSLSALTLRSSQSSEARREAEANARLALLMAIGDLQAAVGPDQRVTARASAVLENPKQPQLLGTWRSWRWQPAVGGAPDYTEKAPRFERWLVSTATPANATDFNFPGREASGVWLVDPSRVPTPPTVSPLQTPPGLRAETVTVKGGANPGGMAWAVLDESAKAPVQLADDPNPSLAERLASRTVPPRARPDALADPLQPLREPGALVSLDTASLRVGEAGRDEIRGRTHDLTAGSLGVLANVVDGGLKTDLTTLLESKDSFESLLGKDQSQPYLNGTAGMPKWDYLRAHHAKYRRLTGINDGQATIKLLDQDLTPSKDKAENQKSAEVPVDERLIPVIAKLQILFSLVAHYNHIGGRVNFFNEKGNPKGNDQYGCPHLVYDTVVTLWNPYDVALDLSKLRIRVWDPPVGFQFKKNADWIREEFAAGEYHGLARFQIANERNRNARRFFTLFLHGAGTSTPPTGPILLMPGEVKVFSPWVETNWTWGMETANEWSPRAFFDWNYGSNFGNRDNRTGSEMGIECIPGWDTRAGLQTDHLSYANRPVATRYDFEVANGWNGGWFAVKLRDTFSVVAKATRTLPPDDTTTPDFAVDVLAAKNQPVETDILRSFIFRFKDVTGEVSAKPATPEIKRSFRIRDILQKPEDKTPGGKSPFAVLTMTAKTTLDPRDVTKSWFHNNPVVDGAVEDTRSVGLGLHSYDLRLEEVRDFNTFPGIEIDPNTKRGFFGASATANRGVSAVPMYRVNRLPAASLGDFIPANLVASSRLPRANAPFGNSWAHPLVPSTTVAKNAGGTLGVHADHSWLFNDALWDRFWVSSICNYDTAAFSNKLTRKALLEGAFAGDAARRPLHHRLLATPGEVEPAERARRLDAMKDAQLSRALAAHFLIQSPFNVNCDSVEAWRAVLSALRDQAVPGWANRDQPSPSKAAFARGGALLAGDADNAGAAGNFDLAGQIRWAGFRALGDTQVQALAEAIVRNIRARGLADKAPFLSAGEFVNRRIGPAGDLHALRGLLQTAIDESGVNNPFHALDSQSIDAAKVPEPLRRGALNPEAMNGMTGEGAPPILTQGDLLMPLAALLTVRGDTLRVRAYGEARDSNNRVTARAWCEAVVQRMPEYLDSATDAAEVAPADLKGAANRKFGRRFLVTGFRWLSPEEA